MAIRKTYTCDVCGTEMKGGSGSFVATRSRVSISFHTWAWAAREQQLDEEETLHLCGNACAHKQLDGFFEEHRQLWLSPEVSQPLEVQ